MHPVKSKESNFTYLGPTRDIGDLPCRLAGNDTFAMWELTDDDRAVIAAGGSIRMGIYGVRPIPPVSLQAVHNAGCYERVATPCVECGKEAADPVHLSGAGTHAFKVAHP